MNEIKCPKCQTIFQIDESEYNSIVKQIKDQEFEKEKNFLEKQYLKDKENEIKILEVKLTNKYQEEVNSKLIEITKLKSEIELKDKEQVLNINKAINDKDKIINDLKNKFEILEKTNLITEKNIKESYEIKLKDKDEIIAYYRDFKAKQSTKMIGESLEQHCSNQFNIIRPLFKNVYFEKDNDIKLGSKGDFIFRNYDIDNTEIVSIMFEMKNQSDETLTKHKNEDFLKELNKDRNAKNCEYAVLVSLLETDNDLYNQGIVDKSHLYPKMYVIRPQFFIPIITLITNIANDSLKYKKELELVKNQNIDISHFEEKINNFKDSFNRNYKLASDKFKNAIDEIDKTILHLQKVKDSLLSSENNLRLANNKIDDLTIKKLTSGNETIAKMFDDLENN